MTTIHVCSSSSKGNGYIIESSGQSLIVELGCKTLDYYNRFAIDDTPKFVGCICSHQHTDHFNPSTVRAMIYRGMDVYAGEKVVEECPEMGLKRLLKNKKTFIGGFTVQPFEIAHNVPNYGFLIETPSGERIVFVTDAIECKYRFKDIDCIMVECNHDDDTLLDNIDKHDVSMSHPENHLGLSDCIAFCKANMNPHLKQVVLIHLSHQNINEEFAMKQVSLAIPHVLVSVAHPDDRFIIENDNF